MCQTYVPEIGYICFSCQDEFKEYLTSKNLEPKTEADYKAELKKFMETSKGMSGDITFNDFFNRYSDND